jgi:hypothetical protein
MPTDPRETPTPPRTAAELADALERCQRLVEDPDSTFGPRAYYHAVYIMLPDLLRVLRERPAWQPMDERAKDGRLVLLGKDMGAPWGFVRGYGRYERVAGVEGWISYGMGHPPGNLGLGDPTHYAELPDPPASSSPAQEPR